jgi:hypothetical protein
MDMHGEQNDFQMQNHFFHSAITRGAAVRPGNEPDWVKIIHWSNAING